MLAAPLNQDWTYDGVIPDEIIAEITTNEREIELLSKNINTNKSSGIQNIATWILRESFLTVPDIIADIINTSFVQCECPNTWKIANVIPLQKEGNKQLVTNLRPVSLLPVQSKIIEKIVHNRIFEHLTNHDLLCKEQGGFREGCSTLSTAALFVNEICKALNDKKYTIVAYLDIKKAFDTVNHEI